MPLLPEQFRGTAEASVTAPCEDSPVRQLEVNLMALLLDQFKEARTRVEPTDADKRNAQSAHADVRSLLESNDELKSLDIDTVLIGSYRRHVSIRRMKDVDVFSELSTGALDLGPRGLLDLFYSILRAEYGNARVLMQDRSVKVAFPSLDLDVDAVPACPVAGHWQIPNRTDRDEPWQETNPETLTYLTEEMNAGHQDLYVPTVKLLRQVRRAHLAKRPNGFLIEALTYQAFATGAARGSNTAEYFCSALAAVAVGLGAATERGIPDPTLPGHVIDTRATMEELETAARRLAELAVMAAEAMGEEDRCVAARIYQEILGRNSDDVVVFPMPEDCGEKARAAVIPGDRLVPAGSRRFA